MTKAGAWDREGLPTGDLRAEPPRLQGYKVVSVALRENELWFRLKGAGTKGTYDLVLRGIIAFEDEGVVGRSLGTAGLEDKGSFRTLSLKRRDGKLLARCDYMEGTLSIGRKADSRPG